MKRVKGCISVRALGDYDFEFYVNDDTTDEEIKKKVDDVCNYSIWYDVDEGYEAYTEVRYRKKREYENWLDE
jgi:hypothetical protein